MDQDIEELIGPANNSPRRRRDLGDLQELLLRVCPRGEDDTASIPILARHLGLTPWAIYKWIKGSGVPASRKRKLLALSAGRITEEELEPFLTYAE